MHSCCATTRGHYTMHSLCALSDHTLLAELSFYTPSAQHKHMEAMVACRPPQGWDSLGILRL